MEEIIQSFQLSDRYQPFYLEMCGISYCDGSYLMSRMNSYLYCFEYIISGAGTVWSDNNVFHPSQGDIYILHEGHDHYYYSDSNNPWVKIWFNIVGEFPRSTIMQYGLNDVNYIKNFNLYPLFLQFVELSKDKSKKTNDIFNEASLIFLQIVHKISEHIYNNENQLPQEALTMKEYIQRNAENNITIQDLASLIHHSYSQTIRIFKKAFFVTPYDYILNTKIETAKLMLQNTNLQVKEISYQLNFSNEYNFSSSFKKKTGFSPKSYKIQKF